METMIVPYIMAGDHELGLEGLPETVEFLAACGASAVEIGIPFSDPVADGKVIQEAGLRALAGGVSLSGTLDKLKTFKSPIPLLIMSYFNPIYIYGVENFVNALQKAGVTGLIIPDLPFEHDSYIAPFLENTDIALIRLVSLTTPRERQEMLVKNAKGFIYAVAIMGTTGVRTENTVHDEHFKFLSQISKIPVLAGFGVSSREHIENYRKVCDGVIVGSYIVNALHRGEREKVAELFV